jgi:hypothetical protein
VDAGAADLQREIEARLREALARFGIAGTVRVQAHRALLSVHGLTVSTELGTLPEQWGQLSHEARVRACTDVVRRLAAQRRSMSAAGAGRRRRSVGWVAALTVLLALAAGYVFMVAPYLDQSGDGSQPVRRHLGPAPDLDAAERERQQRAWRVCSATASRVAQGASVGPTDTEGWVVETMLLGDGAKGDLRAHPALAKFVERAPGQDSGHFVWQQTPSLTQIEGPATRVTVADAGLDDPAAPRWRGVRLTFTGRYVAPYFDEQRRAEYVRVMHALVQELGATHAALYARCAQGHHHQLGSCFVGPSPAQAAAMLVYSMGLFAPVPHVSGLLRAGDAGNGAARARAFNNIIDATKPLDRTRLASIVGAQDGLITGPQDGPATITFPFRNGSLAGRASLQIARFAGLASPH